MNYEKYISLIKELELYAAKNPKSYRNRVVLLAILGYGYIIGLIVLLLFMPLLILLGLIVNAEATIQVLTRSVVLWWLWVPLAAVYFGILGGLFKAFGARVPEPKGRELARKEAPELFEFITGTCKKLKASRPGKILISDEFNATVVTLPRFGMFGRKVYLVLGLPLMDALSPQQFRAVVTHEIGHISEKHGGIAKWMYQLHESWGRIIDSQAVEGNRASFLYDKFVKWFFPYFSAYAFVLMRGHEREADIYAVEYVGAQHLGEALLAVRTKEAMLSEVFWKKIEKENAERETPSGELFSRMMLAFKSVDPERDRSTIEKAMQIPTDYADTHPSLTERLKLIGYWDGADLPLPPEPIENSAAVFYLKDIAKELTGRFDSEWEEQAGRGWKERHEHFQKSRQRLVELSTKDDLTANELYEKAALTAERERKDALPLLKELVALHPEHADGTYALGVLLLEEDDESGFELLKRSVELDKKLELQANEVAFQYLRAKGKFEEAKDYAAALEQNYEEMALAEKERTMIYITDVMIPHQVSEENLESIRRVLSYHEEIIAAFIVGKEVKHFSHIPFHGLFIVCDLRLSKTSGITAQDLMDTLAKEIFQYNVSFIHTFDPVQNKANIDKVSQVEGALVYSAK